MAEPTGPVLVVIPTYDERENLRPVLARVHRAVPDADVLVVDDASPDGTGELADELAADDPHLHVLHRTGKAGLGAAYLAGFSWAMARDYRVVVQMDADGSHPPEALPALLTALGDADLVIGSRYVPGGEVRNWPVHREWLSRGGNLYSRVALGIPTRDVTAGYRVFRRQVLAELDLDSVASQGYCFQIDMTWRALQGGFQVVEVPITFTERERGTSKMSGAIVGEALWQVARWGTRRLLRRPDPTARARTASPASPQATPEATPVERGHDPDPAAGPPTAPASDPCPVSEDVQNGAVQDAAVQDAAVQNGAVQDGAVSDGSVRA